MSSYEIFEEEVKDSDSEQGDSDTSDIDDWDLPKNLDKPQSSEPVKSADQAENSWRVKEKYKTHCVALVLCLNVGVDPPDVVKTQPCARLECWIDPQSLSPAKALETIGQALQAQYERWQPRARYKQSLDPTSEEVKKLCCSLRRNAKEERVLFHYNGHGVPKPTAQGEIWVFNRTYTQYIPLSMFDLQSWMGAPSLYVYDCSNAGLIVDSFRMFAEQHERDAMAAGAAGAVSYRNCIQLGACAAGQTLPAHPALPADLFTACLTTPVLMAVRWSCQQRRAGAAPDLTDKIPGQVSDRRTMLGELNWIFTAVTDTIAWSVLPRALFQQLFRADLLTASLCRNFLLAERVMRHYNCSPVSSPALPALHRHPLWTAWDHTLDLALAQLPQLRRDNLEYAHSPFFQDQLTAFTVWLDLGNWQLSRRPPEQLPMVLQVLLSTLHRVRALQILCRFLALGARAVRLVLAVGIFPYMLKLLQASAADLRPTMVYIWAKIIAEDPSCQVDLVNAKGHKYFLSVLQDSSVDLEHRTLAAFVLAGIVDNYPPGQEAAIQGGLISVCLEAAREGMESLAQEEWGGRLALWSVIACGLAWRGRDAARWLGARDLAHEKLLPLLGAGPPRLRAAAAFALSTFVAAGAARDGPPGGPAARGGPPGGPAARSDHANALDQQVARALALHLASDADHRVRQEILTALQWPVMIFEQQFIAIYIQERMMKNDKERRMSRGVEPGQDALLPTRSVPPAPLTIGAGSVYSRVWAAIDAMSREPYAPVADMAASIIAYIANQVTTCSVSAECAAVSVPRSAPASSPAPAPSPASPAAACSSLPPSPNTRPPMPEHMPHNHTLPGAGRRGISSSSHSSDHGLADSDKKERQRDSSTTSLSVKKPIVSTKFVEWAWKEMAADSGPRTAEDCESREYHERQWRRARNRALRGEAKELAGAQVPRLESQVFHSRCLLPPAVVLFHPYDQHIAVASKDNFGIWDWGTAARLASGGWRPAWGRITALEWAADGALLCAAGAGGELALWGGGGAPRGGGGALRGGGGALRAAWRALDARPAAPRPPPGAPVLSLAQLVSEQWSPPTAQSSPAHAHTPDNSMGGGAGPGTVLAWLPRRGLLGVAGAAPHVALWALGARRLAARPAAGGAVTALGAGGALLAAGRADGRALLLDARQAAPVATLLRHAAPIRAAKLRQDRAALVTICAAGEVVVWDQRTWRARAAWRAPPPLAAADVHPRADLLACGSVNQCISVYDLSGNSVSNIRFHEGFMAARIGPVSSLAFHPLKIALAVGSKDSTVSVYTAERR